MKKYNPEGMQKSKSEAVKSGNFLWFEIEANAPNSRCCKRAYLDAKKPRRTVTTEQIEKKLQEAEERRKTRLQRRSERAAETREQMADLANKLQKLHAHHEVTSNGTEKDAKLSRREYTRLANEVSITFENLSQRYTTDLNRANAFYEHIAQSSIQNENLQM